MIGAVAFFVPIYVQALAAPPALFATEPRACGGADIAFTADNDPLQQRCSGGWLAYEQPCFRLQRSSHCPAETFKQIIEYESCEHEDFGPASYRREQTAGGHFFPGLLTRGVTEESYRAQKQREAERDLAKQQATNSKYKFATVRLEATTQGNGHVWYERVVERVVDHWNVGQGPNCPIARQIDGEPETYSECRHPAHGEAPVQECGFSLFYAPQATLAQVQSVMPGAAVDLASPTQAPTCLTCENLPLGNEARAVAKFDCLISSIVTLGSRAQMTPKEVSSTKGRLHKQLLLLQEFAGNQLQPDHRLYFRTLFAQIEKDDPGCGARFRQPINANQSVAQAWGPLYACRRLLLSHVPHEVARGNNVYCQGLIKEVAAHRSGLSLDEQEALLWLMNSFAEVALQ